MGKLGTTLAILAATTLLISGCDPVTRHNITSTIFDGVPSLPPAEEFCKDYHERALAEEQEALKRKLRGQVEGSVSIHPPYKEKQCNNCHDKNSDSGFVAPVKELCYVCHKDFLKGNFAHGPAAVGDCLACHVPHDSKYPKLLKRARTEVCGACHLEKRLADQMHSAVVGKGMACSDCHNPHAGNARFFLD
jgi:predicted CXXCH cytochrome family protein